MAKVTSKSVDFTDVKDGSGFRKTRVPQGDYRARITTVVDSPSKKDDVFQWLFTIDLPDGGVYPYYCKLQENQLWKLRNLFVAAGINVPKKKVKVDPTKVVGKWIGVTMEDDEYEGKLQSNIAAVMPLSELGDEVVDSDEDDEDVDDEEEEDEEEEAPEPPKRKKRKPAPEPEPEEEEEDEEEEEEEEDDEDEEEEEEEPPPPPARKKKVAAKKAAPAKKRKAAVVDDDELEELDIDGI